MSDVKINDELLNQYEQERSVVYGKTKKFYIIGAIFGIGGFVGLFVFFNMDLPIPGFICIALVAIAAILCVLATKQRMDLQNRFKKAVLASLIKELFPDSTYTPDQGFSESKVLEPGFFKAPDRYYSKDYISASYDGVPFEMSNFDCQEVHYTTDSEGHVQTSYQTYAKGRMIIIDFKREINDTVKILETTMLGANLKGLTKVQTESVEFNKKFKTYSDNSLTTFYILTPQIQLKLLELETKFNGSIFFAYQKGKFYLCINDNKESLTMNLGKKLDQEAIDQLAAQISLPAAIINELKLNDTKFNSDQKYGS